MKKVDEPDLSENGPPDPVPPLEYMPPRHDREMLKARRREKLDGGALSCGVVFVAVFIYILGSIRVTHRPQPRTMREILSALAVPAALFLYLGLVAAYQHFVRRRRWFIQGVLIGIGIACLIEGACFALNVKW